MNKSYESEPFDCRRLRDVTGEGTCEITFEVVEKRSMRSAREPVHRVKSGFDCDSARDCGAASASGEFDPSKCVHPTWTQRRK